jgi:hypothetical protein
MNGRSRSAGPAAVVLVLALNAGLSLAARPAGPLRSFLPSGNDVPGCAMDGQPQEYEGEDLFTYIDGGAEIYQEYGFRRVIVQDYESAAGKSISLEIFEMETSEAAYGMFSFKRSGSGKAMALGDEAELESYYLNLWKGRYLVTLTGFDDSRGTVYGILALGAVVGAKLPDGGSRPGIVSGLPAAGLVPGSVKYLKGLLGLNNLYPFFTARGLSFTEAARGLFEDGTTLILLDYGTDEGREAAWAELRGFLESSDRFARQTTERDNAVLFVDGKGRFVAFGGSRSRLAIGVGATAAGALDIIARAR